MSGKVGDNIFRASGVIAAAAAAGGGAVDWCTTAATSPFTAVSANGYFVNTCGGAVTVTLPSSPSANDIVSLADYKSTWAVSCKAVTLGRGGSKINGSCIDAILSTQGQSVTMLYVDATQGWKSIQDSTSDVVGAAPYNVEYLVVAAGAGGAAPPDYAGGGGGAGGYRTAGCFCVGAACAPYTVTVGGGGAGGTTSTGGTVGDNSVFATITSTGGGGGTGQTSDAVPQRNGGSGGGTGGGAPCSYAGGLGNTPPTTPPQGNNGGAGAVASNDLQTGGGGGAQATGVSGGGANVGGAGGAGRPTDMLGCTPTAGDYGTPGPSTGRYFAGGGGGRGGWAVYVGTAGAGGVGGGGEGTGDAACESTGGGGGGNRFGTAGNGGSGIVMIKYTTDCASGSVSGGTATVCGSTTTRVFTETGTFTP